MKHISSILYTSLLVISIMATSATSSERNTSFAFNKLSQSLCSSAANDDLIKLRSKLTKARTHIRTVYLQVTCDGVSLLTMAKSNQADTVVN